MKLCFFYEGLRPGGVEHMASNLSFEFERRGHTIDFIFAGSPTDLDYPMAPSSKITWLRSENLSARGSIWALSRILRNSRYEAIISAMPPFNNAAVISSLLSGRFTPNLLTERTNPFADYNAEKSLFRRMWHRSSAVWYRIAAAKVAVSQALADDLSEFAHLPRSSIDVIYNPAYNEAPYPLQPEYHPWLDGSFPVIVSAGRLYPQKDYPTLLRATKLALKEEDFRVVILGDGPEKASLQKLAIELEIEHAVDFAGFYKDIRPTLERSGHFVLSSAWEGFGNVLVEALGVGCSIVSTDCPNGPSEILNDGRFGSLVPVGDHEALAIGMVGMLRRPAERQTQISRAKEFSVPIAADQYESVLRRIVRTK